MISGLQHYAYCPRQFALIHVEKVWTDNYFTAHGNQLHTRVDGREPEQRGSMRYERAVSVRSDIHGLTGKLDLLEIEDNPLRYRPVEYKRGKLKADDWDCIQLCAQAICLEEMRSITINEGALWYWQERKRHMIDINDALRERTLEIIERANDVLTNGCTPKPIDDRRRCRGCSLVDLCRPDVFQKDVTRAYIRALFDK